MSHWLEYPTTTAPNPDKSKDNLTLRLSPELVSQHFAGRRLTPLFQAWCPLFGELPPINNIGKVAKAVPPPTLTTLHDAVACFGGIQRPHDKEQNGDSVLVYVLNPPVSIEFSPSLVCMAQPVQVPVNSVLTVQVRPNFPLQQGRDGVEGLITKIEYVFGDERDSRLPRDYDSRYGKNFWVNQP
jgi:hypothetical protein